MRVPSLIPKVGSLPQLENCRLDQVLRVVALLGDSMRRAVKALRVPANQRREGFVPAALNAAKECVVVGL